MISKPLFMKKYRTNGAIGALLDEYQKSIFELQSIIKNISQQQLTTIADPETKDPDCRSIQTILTHVLGSGYYYATAIRQSLGENVDLDEGQILTSVEKYDTALNEMFAYNEQLFEDYPHMKIEEYETSKKILTRWGQTYDPEQILEHAIVHILRHRRQIERFLLKMA